MNDGITINSELDLYEKGGNSTHARWIADKLLNARKLGIISEVELAVLDTALSDDFGKYEAYRTGYGHTIRIDSAHANRFSSGPVVRGGIIDEVGHFEDPEVLPELSKVAEAISQAREYLLMTSLHFDETAVGADHLMHYIKMAQGQIEKALSCDGVEVSE